MSELLTILTGDALEHLRSLPNESIQCCVTSPPYWGLRDYGVSGQLGLEKTPDEYVSKMVEVFREVRRVLKKDGTLWLNLGDTYHQGNKGQSGEITDPNCKQATNAGSQTTRTGEALGPNRTQKLNGIKPKDLVGIPWSVAKALQRPYYCGRIKCDQDAVWLSAILDAEGCICGFDHDRADGNGHRSGVHITITNTSTALLDECARIWPASRSEHENHGESHLGNKPSWRWIVHGVENKIALLRDIYPRLIAKRKQAIAAHSLLLLMRDAKRLGHSPQKDVTLQKRAVLTKLISDLNQNLNPVMPDWLTEPESLLSDGWYLRQDIIWSKPNPMPESVTDRCTKAHEYLFLLTKSASYFYDAQAIQELSVTDDIRRPYGSEGSWELDGRPVEQRPNGQPRYKTPDGWDTSTDEGGHGNFHRSGREAGQTGYVPKGKTGKNAFRGQGAERDSDNGPANRNGREMQNVGAGFTRNKRSVWNVATAPFPEAHFATYPADLIKPCILAGTKPGDVVLDPFAGSGTTGMVALELGRKALLIELNPEYVKLIEQRCNVTTGLAL